MKELVWVALGGALGSVSRFKLGSLIGAHFPAAFPVATLAVNLLGCFLIGILVAIGEKRGALTPEARLLLQVGVLGGFTTFSAFGLETFALLRAEKLGLALLYVGLSALGGVLMVALGFGIIEWLSRAKN